MKKKKKINKTIKQTIIVFIIALILFYLLTTIYILVKTPTNIYIVDNGTISFQEETNGVIIREEQVIEGENYENGMLQIKNEGERVAKGEAIFKYYNEQEESIKEEISIRDEEIKNKIQNSEPVISSDIALLEEQIKTKLCDINTLTDLQKIGEIKRDINTNIEKKIDIIGDNSQDSQIKKLIEQRKELQNKLAKNSEYITAPISGVVSYRVDGLEERFKSDDINNISKEVINGIGIKTGQIIATSEEKGKIINNFESYIVANMNSDIAKNAKEGDYMKLQISSLNEINSEIIHIRIEDDDSRTIVFKINKKIEDLAKYRKIPMNIIWWEYNGFKIPKTAILTENGRAYVIRNRAGYKDKILVKIEKQNDTHVIVNNYTRDELKALGYSEKEINSMNTLNLYDEIFVEN